MNMVERELFELTSANLKGALYQSLDSFVIEGKIGKGQFSVVYRGICLTDRKPVAIKKVQLFEMMNSKSRFDCLKEINLLQALNHPNIIKYYASFIEQNELDIVLELADAGDLSRMIKAFQRQRKLIAEKTIWKYFVQICSALQYMHSKRIMHRDIKPANVFVTSEGVVKLGDLGLGRYFSHKTIIAHTLVGTPFYMSPEILQERGYSFKSDIWSLGCLLYELAALHSPFYAFDTNMYILIKKIEKCDYPPLPSNIYSDKLRKLIRSCITADQSLRPDIVCVYNTAHEMNTLYNSRPLFPPRTSLQMRRVYNVQRTPSTVNLQRTPSTVSIAPEHEKRYFKNCND